MTVDATLPDTNRSPGLYESTTETLPKRQLESCLGPNRSG